MAREIILAGGARTPFGDYGKSLKDVPLAALGTHAAKACLARAGVAAADVDHLVFGNVLPVDQQGYFIARVVALEAGMAEDSRAMNVNRACASGTQAIVTAAEQMLSGHSRLALAGGGENFSRAPYVAENVRWGLKRGPQAMVDTLDWAYRDPFSLELMGETAENLAEDFQYRREDMDAWGVMSQNRAGAAIASGFLAQQIAPIDVPERKGTRRMETDEFPRPEVTLEKLATLKPVFRQGGKVTPGNSSGVTDGAAMVLVAERERADALGIDYQIRLVDWALVGVPPRIMGCGPVPAVQDLLRRTGLSVGDIDYFEINEAFAVVNLHAEACLKTPRAKTNLYGGGISIGHPPGATGARMTITAMQHLIATGERYAVISMCIGAGQGMAVLIENLKAASRA
ncbi:MAG: thiolase family protein [Alphaproteobacteria bacterium]|nr:thiolase family protein [Alphaproteobacteria bacterium]